MTVTLSARSIGNRGYLIYFKHCIMKMTVIPCGRQLGNESRQCKLESMYVCTQVTLVKFHSFFNLRVTSYEKNRH